MSKHGWSDLSYLPWLRHLVRSRLVTNMFFFREYLFPFIHAQHFLCHAPKQPGEGGILFLRNECIWENTKVTFTCNTLFLFIICLISSALFFIYLEFCNSLNNGIYIRWSLRKYCARKKKIGLLGEKKIRFVIAINLIKCLKQIK